MKTPRFILAGSLLAVALSIALPHHLAAAPAKEEILVDFTDVSIDRTSGVITKNYEYDFGDWKKHLTDLPGRGCLVQAKTGKGGLGENNPRIAFVKAPTVSLVFVIGNANNAKSITFSLEDKDGTEQQWNIPFQGMAKGKVYYYPLDLAKCTNEQKPGKTPGMNLKKINAWQVKGDYSDSNVEVLLMKLVAPKTP